MQCGDYNQLQDKLTGEEREVIASLERIEDKVLGMSKVTAKTAKALRAALGFRHEGKGDPRVELEDMLYSLGVDVKNGQIPRIGTLNEIERIINNRLDQIAKMGDVVEKGHFRHPIVEYLGYVLPESKFKQKILAGEVTWEAVGQHQSRNESMVSTAMDRAKELARLIEQKTGEVFPVKQGELTRAQEAFDKADAAVKILTRKSRQEGLAKEEASELEANVLTRDAARDELERLATEQGGNKSVALSRAAIELIENPNVDLSRIGDKITHAKAADLARGAGIERPKDIIEVAKYMKEFFDDYKPYVQEAFDLARKNMEAALRSSGMTEEQIRERMKQMPTYQERDHFYPHRVALSLWDMENAARKVGELNTRETEDLLGEVWSKHLEARENNAGIGTRHNKNIPETMYAYVGEISHMLMMNRIHNSFNEALEIVRSTPWEKGVQDKYIDLLQREFARIEHSIVPDNMTTRKAVGMSMLAWVAANKLAWNVPGMVNNIFEGRTILWANAGVHLKKQVDGLLKGEHGTFLREHVLNTEHVEMIAGQEWGASGNATRRNEWLGAMMDPATVKEYTGIEVESAAVASLLEKASAKITGAATWATQGWRAFENNNRVKAFMVGSVLELQRVHDMYYAEFMEGNVRGSIKEKYGLKDVDWNDPAARQKAWVKFAKEKSAAAGYDMLYGTQWMYNMMARHSIEGVEVFNLPVGKFMAMFQHYPLSWANRAYNMYHTVQGLHRAAGGGFAPKWAFRATDADIASGKATPLRPIKTGLHKAADSLARHGHKEGAEVVKSFGDEAGNFVLNPNAQFMMAIGISAFAVQAIAALFNMEPTTYMTHPSKNLLQSLIQKMRGDEDEKVLYGRGVLNEISGPAYTELMDTMSLFAMKSGLRNRNIPGALQEFLNYGIGFKPDEEHLTHGWKRDYDDIFDPINQAFLWESNSAYRKGRRMVRNLAKTDDPTRKMGIVATELTPFYPNWDAATKAKKQREFKPST